MRKVELYIWIAVISGALICLFIGFLYGSNRQKPGVEPLVITSHSREDVYNEHMLNNCLIQLKALKGGVSDVK